MPPAKDAFRGASLYSGIFDTQEPRNDSKPSESSSTPTEPSSSSQPPAAAAAGSDTPNKSSGWSAALRFAPRRTAAAAKPKARPNAAFVASFAPPAASSTEDQEAPPKGSISRAPGVAPKSLIDAPPDLASSDTASRTVSEATPKLLTAADTADLNLTALSVPATHADDEAIIAELEKRPVLAPPPTTLPEKEIEREKQLIRQSRQPWNQEEEYYDEADDEDVNGFLATSAGKKANRRRKKRKRGNSPPAGPDMNADYDPRIPNDYMAYKHMVYQRRSAELEYRKWQQERQQQDDYYGEEEEDEGWYEDEPEPELEHQDREMERSDRYPPPEPPGKQWSEEQQPPPPPPPAPMPQTGEEAYQRRLALTHASTGEEAYQRRLALSQAHPPPPGPPPPRPPLASDLASRQSAAAAIAARLAASQSKEVMEGGDASTFAERLMRSQGFTPGTGLGAEGNKGITAPLTAIQSGSNKGRGTIVDPNHPVASDDSRFGPTSPIVALLNLAQPQDILDPAEKEELVQDVATECNKFGYVERVLTHLHREEEVRVFVKFTGHAGSYKAVRALDARWFEGRQVQAFFYPEDAFQHGQLGLPLTRS